MNKHNDHFSPDHVDEQIEQLSWESTAAPAQSEPAKDLLEALQLLYEEEKEEDEHTLDQAWLRITTARDQQQRNRSQNIVRSIMIKEPGTFSIPQPDQPLRKSRTQRFAILAAVACFTVLLGGAAFLFPSIANAWNTHTGGGGGPIIAPISSTTTVPTTPAQVIPKPGSPSYIKPIAPGSDQITPAPSVSDQVTPSVSTTNQAVPVPAGSDQVTPAPSASSKVAPIP